MSALRGVAIAPIRAYQRVISPLLPRRCKYEPSCSSYAAQALQEYGICAGWSSQVGGCCAAIRGATGATTPSASSASSTAAGRAQR